MTPNAPLSRKDISQLCGGRLSPLQIARRERELGLHKARVKFHTRMVLFRPQMAKMILRNLGFIE